MNVTAVVLTAAPIALEIPGVVVHQHVSQFNDATGLLAARVAALRQVKTEWFFYLDDDDALPLDYQRVLDRCTAVDTPLAYTNELITQPDGTSFVRHSCPYKQIRHIKDYTLIHHLAVCRTEAALRATSVIPRGMYAVENLLFFQVAKEGATFIDEVGYHWRRRAGGLSRHHSVLIGLVQSAIWASRNRD